MKKGVELFHTIEVEHKEELCNSDQELRYMSDVLTNHEINAHKCATYLHAVYLDELIVLTMADMQLHQITILLNEQIGKNCKDIARKDTFRLASNKVLKDGEELDLGSEGSFFDDLVYEDHQVVVT